MFSLRLGLSLGSGQGGPSGPVITINGLTGGVAEIGDHASLTMSVSEGTITARAWGSTPGGSEYGTGTNPTDYEAGDGGTLYATATVGGDDYSRSAPIRYAVATVSVAAAASGDPVIGESLTGTSATFTGDDLTEGDEWEVGDDGATGWTGTADTDTTGPAMVSGKYYRFTSTATNSGGSVTSSSSAIGPAVAPVISISGLTSGNAIIGDHASISGSSDIGTITAEKWGSASSGSEFGTGTNPTDFASADGGLLWYTPTIGGVEYPTSVDVTYAVPSAAGAIDDETVTEDTGVQTYDVSGDFTNAVGGTWSLPTTITGVTINSSGVVQIDTDVLALQTDTPIVVRYTNSGGVANSGFSLTVEEAAGTVPTTSLSTITRGTSSVTLNTARDVFEYPDGSFGILSTGGDVVITADAPAWQNDTYGNGMHGLMLLSDLQAQSEGVGEQGFDETAGINHDGTDGVTKPTYAAIYNSALNKAPSFTTSNLTIATSGGTGGCIKMIRRADRALEDGEISNSELIEDLIVIHCVPTLPQVGEMPPPLMGTGIGLNTSDVDLSVIRSSFTVPTSGELSTLTSVADCLEYMSIRTLVNVWEGETRRSMCHIRNYAQSVLRTYVHPAAFHIMNPATDTDDRDQLIAYFLRHAEDAYAIQDSGGYQRGGAGQTGVDHFILAFVAALCPSKTALMTKSQARVSNLNELAVWVQAGDVGKGGRYESRTGLLANTSYHNNRPVMPEMAGEAQWIIQALDLNVTGDWGETNNTLPSARYCGQNHEIAINSYCMLGLIEKGWEAIFGAQATWNTSNDAYANFVFAERLYASYDSRMLVIASENLAAWAKPIWDAERATMPEGGTPLAVHGSKPLDLSTEELDATVGSMSPVFADSGTGMTWDMTNVNRAGTQWTGSVTALTDQEFRFSHDTVQWGAPVSVGTGSSGSHTFTGKRYVQYRGTNAAGSAPWSSVWALFDGDFTDSGLTVPKPWYINYMGGAAIPAGNPVNTEAPKIYVHTWDENAGWPEYTSVTGTMAAGLTKLIAGAGLWADGVNLAYQWEYDENGGSEIEISGETAKEYQRTATVISTETVTRRVRCKITATDDASGETVVYTPWLTMPEAATVTNDYSTNPLPIFGIRHGYAEWNEGTETIRIYPTTEDTFAGAANKLTGLIIGQEYDFSVVVSARDVGSGEIDGQITDALVTYETTSYSAPGAATASDARLGGTLPGTLTWTGIVATASTMYLTTRFRGGVPSNASYIDVTSVSAVPVVAADETAPVLSSPTAAEDGGTGATSLGVTTDEDNGTLYWGIYPTASTPSAADVVAGTGATVSGSQAVSGTGVQSVSDQTGLTSETAYKAHYVHDDDADNRSNLATSSEFTTDDVTAPTLSSPTGAEDGETGATSLGVSTNEGSGTLYWGIYPTASTPSAADVVAGTGATVDGSQAVSGTGVQSISDQTGLTADTAYKVHYVQDDAASNRSSVATSAEFTTDAGASLPPGTPQLYADFRDGTSMSLTGTLVDSITPAIGVADLTGDTTTRPDYVSTIQGGGGLRFTGDHITIPTGYSFDKRNMSVFVVTRRGARDFAGYQAIFHASASSTVTALFQENGGSKLGVWDGGAVLSTIRPGDGVSLQYMVGGASNCWIGSDYLRWARGSAMAAGSTTGARLGKWTGSSFPYKHDILAVVAYDAEMTTGEMDAVVAWAQSEFGTPVADEVFVFDGDSITEGIQDANPQLDPHATDFSFPARFQLLRSSTPRIHNTGDGGGALNIAGNLSATRVINALTQNPGVTDKYVFGLWGHNDITGGRTGAQLSADLDTWIANIRAVHPTAIIGHGTILSSTGFSEPRQAQADIFNAYVLDEVTGPDLDFRIDTEAATGVTKVDGVHPDSDGYLALATYIEANMP